MKDLILASQSPRRREILSRCGIPFLVDAADIDEHLNESLSLSDAVKELSLRKAMAVLERHPDSIVIGSDTIVTLDGAVLGKPADQAEAEEMLARLSGRTHEVITGLAIVSSRKIYQNVSVSEVTMNPLSKQDITSYIQTGEAYDKAGAYGIQGFAGNFIPSIHGDFYAIMGLPLSMVYEELKNAEDY
ncbi:MAG: septum formation protein Maf [Solobacterium sp.]|nr:septum formation protein Maf [Solobacterium sp.]